MKRVMLFGTFDGIHAGHRYLFRQARRYGDELIAVVARDSTVQKVKGHLPRMNERERLMSLIAERYVDTAVLGSLRDKYSAIRLYCPDVICLGYDQQVFIDGIGKNLRRNNLSLPRIVRLFALAPHRYKSSKIKADIPSISDRKMGIRLKYIKKREALSPLFVRSYGRKISELIAKIPRVKKSKVVCLPLSFRSEVDTSKLLQVLFDQGKIVCVPVVQSLHHKTMRLCQIAPDTEFVRGLYGILVPRVCKRFYGSIDVCFVPGVAFSKVGDRIGMGKGYYDRFLARHRSAWKVGLAYPWQVVEILPQEKHDVRLNYIVAI